MSETRAYRTNLASIGLVYMGSHEHKITIKNLSLTGLLAEFSESDLTHDVKDIFQTIKISPVIDIYLPELKLAGEVEVVRSDMIDGHINLALEFRNLSYEIDNVLYSRRVYRKNLTSPGQIIFNGETHVFNTENVSVDGLMIRLDKKVEVEEGTVTTFDFKRLELSGEIKVIWVQYDNSTTIIGLEYLYLEKDSVKGIPRFSHEGTSTK